MNILFVRVPLESCELVEYGTFSYFGEPTGLNYIAEAAAKRGHAVKIHDMYLDPSPDGLLSVVSDYRPDVVGLSSLIIGYDNVTLLSKMVKAIDPAIKIVVGGPCTFMPSILMMQYNPDIDYVIKGEGEVSFARLCDLLAATAGFDFREIDGLAYRADGHIVENPKTRFINARSIEFPVNRYQPYKDYMQGSIITTILGTPPIVFMEASRGCSFKCNFCGVSEPYRKRDPEKVVSELEWLKKKHNARHVIFADYSFTANRIHAETICSLMIERNLKLEWGCDTRVDCVSLPLLKLMRRAGCRVIFYGIESFSQQTLDVLNKGTKIAAIHEALKNTRKAGIQSLAYMMLGAPGETREMILKNAETLHKSGVDYALWGIVRLFSGTPLFESAVQMGVVHKHCGEMGCLSGDIDQIPVFSNTLTYDEMKDLEMNVTRRFYYRLGYVIRRLTRIRDGRELVRLIKQVRYLFINNVLRFC
ncbi:hypothetical protein DSCO28_16540 [Desulfosarcina ovata subsp. sediminis]|uniref:Uncharacterized protein n=1 Tax=Desulfosarcina ovata subsp. sediminis TaxID=885957 RepID=A0A5K7ZFY9_9BACT|nr:radical SAM protein [Desulfosarcina ovata]BBO81088.1 hypothetical protein DSCO28_16540 [Desulfosarcina ovata subsp. sediminis]